LTCAGPSARWHVISAALRLPTLGYTVESFAPTQLIRRISRPASPFGLPAAVFLSAFDYVVLRAALCSLSRNRPFAWFPASARWHVFRFQVSSFRFFLPPSPRRCPTGCFRMFPEMIAKLFHLLLARSAFIRPLLVFQRRFTWQSEFLFVPAKPPLRYDTIRRPMTGVPIERVTRNLNSRSL